MFVSFEGPEGAGKTTQVVRLVERLDRRGVHVLRTREPGGTSVGERIREILLGLATDAPNERAEALLFNAARAQLVERVIRPALAGGAIVVADRFADSTIAYQVHGRGLPRAEVEQIIQFATSGLAPDLTFLLDLPIGIGLQRKPDAQSDRLDREDLGFHERVRQGFLALAAAEPKRFIVVDSLQPPDDISEKIWAALQARLT